MNISEAAKINGLTQPRYATMKEKGLFHLSPEKMAVSGIINRMTLAGSISLNVCAVRDCLSSRSSNIRLCSETGRNSRRTQKYPNQRARPIAFEIQGNR